MGCEVFSLFLVLNERFWGCLTSHATIPLLNIYIYIYISLSLSIYIYIYIYISTQLLAQAILEQLLSPLRLQVHNWRARLRARLGKGQMGSALMGSLQIWSFWQRDLLGIPANLLFIFPEVPGRTFFHNLSKMLTFAVAPLVLTPFVRNQPLSLTVFCAWQGRAMLHTTLTASI